MSNLKCNIYYKYMEHILNGSKRHEIRHKPFEVGQTINLTTINAPKGVYVSPVTIQIVGVKQISRLIDGIMQINNHTLKMREQPWWDKFCDEYIMAKPSYAMEFILVAHQD